MPPPRGGGLDSWAPRAPSSAPAASLPRQTCGAGRQSCLSAGRDGRQAGVSWWPGAAGGSGASSSGAHSWGHAFICRMEGGISGGLGPLHPRSTTHGQGPLPPALAPHDGLSLIQGSSNFRSLLGSSNCPFNAADPRGTGRETRGRERQRSRGDHRGMTQRDMGDGL